MNGSVAPCTSSPFPSHKRNGQKVDRSTSRRVVVAVASARATTREENEAVRGQQACSCLCDRDRGWAGGREKYAPLFVSSAALTLICKWSPKFYTYVCICICLGTGTFSNPNGEIVKLLFIGPPRPRFIPLVLSCRRSAVQGKERGIHLPAGHVDRGSCFSPGRGSLSSFIRVIN